VRPDFRQTKLAVVHSCGNEPCTLWIRLCLYRCRKSLAGTSTGRPKTISALAKLPGIRANPTPQYLLGYIGECRAALHASCVAPAYPASYALRIAPCRVSVSWTHLEVFAGIERTFSSKRTTPMCPHPPRRRIPLAAFAAVLFSMCFAAHGQSAVRVGSKIDTEGSLLGNLMMLVLEANGIKTENRLQLGTTAIVRTALVTAEIDLCPEYTGNGAFFLADERNPAWKDARAGYERVRTLDLARNNLVWLQPAPANNAWAIAIRKDVAGPGQLKTMDDFGRWVSSGGKVKLAASAEFVERPDALPALQAVYGFKLRQDQLVILAGGDTAATIKAAAEHTSDVNAAMAYGTDGPLAALGLVVLEDTKGVQPVYAPAPVIRSETLSRQPTIAALLAPVMRSLDGPTLQRLNAQILLDGQDARTVAETFLRSKGLIR